MTQVKRKPLLCHSEQREESVSLVPLVLSVPSVVILVSLRPSRSLRRPLRLCVSAVFHLSPHPSPFSFLPHQYALHSTTKSAMYSACSSSDQTVIAFDHPCLRASS